MAQIHDVAARFRARAELSRARVALSRLLPLPHRIRRLAGALRDKEES